MMTYRYFINGVERKVEDMTEEEKRNRANAMVNFIGGKMVSSEIAEEYFKKKQVTA